MSEDLGYKDSHELFWARNFFEGMYATNASGKKKKVALCTLCNQTLQNTSIKRLEGHRKACNGINGNQAKRFKSETSYMENNKSQKLKFEPKNEIMDDELPDPPLQIVSAMSLTDAESDTSRDFKEPLCTEAQILDDITPSSSTGFKTNVFAAPTSGKNADELMTKFLIAYDIPFDIVDSSKFKELITEINSEYQLPDKSKISTILLKQIDNDTLNEEMRFAKNESILLVMSRETAVLEYDVLTYLYIQEDAKEVFLKLFKFSGKINFSELIQTSSNIAKQYFCTNIFGVVCNVDYSHFQNRDFTANLFDVMITDENEIFYSECHLRIIDEFLKGNTDNKIVKEVSGILREYSSYWDDIKDNNGLEENHNAEQYFVKKPYNTLDGMKYILDNLQQFEDAFAKLTAQNSTAILEKLNLLQDDNFIIDLRLEYEYMKSLTDLKSKVESPWFSLAEAVEEWAIIDCNTSHDEFSKAATRALRPLGIAANILHPIFRGEKLNAKIRDLGEEFLMNYLDSEGLESYESYLSKKDMFQILSKKPNLTWSTYWSLVSRKHPSLAKLAKRLLKMPAITRSNGVFDTLVNKNNLTLENFNKYLHIQHCVINNNV